MYKLLFDRLAKVNPKTNVPENAVFTDTTYNLVSTSEKGLMSAEDKVKLDSIKNDEIIYLDTEVANGENKLTIQGLVSKIFELEEKIKTLESYHTTTA